MADISVEKIKKLLEPILGPIISLSKVGSSEKGDGYVGDIVFVKVTTASSNLNLVLKCSKNSPTLRQSVPVKAVFENEINLYGKIIPAFREFQQKKQIEDVFQSVPEYFGCFISHDQEVIVLGDLKVRNFFLCDRKAPLPRKYLEIVLKEYGRFHALSAAMLDQEPEIFRKILEGKPDAWKLFCEQTDPTSFFGAPIEEAYELIKDEMGETAEKLKKFISQIDYVLKNLLQEKCFSVVTHGDCWCNNFMFHEKGKVAMLDFQGSKFFSPVMDLSYFIFACASEGDLNRLEELLALYYESFTKFGRLLGSEPQKLYPFEQLLSDFKIYGKFGAILAFVGVKVALSDKEEAPDFAESSETGFRNTFNFKNKNQKLMKERYMYIVKSMEKQNLLI